MQLIPKAATTKGPAEAETEWGEHVSAEEYPEA